MIYRQRFSEIYYLPITELIKRCKEVKPGIPTCYLLPTEKEDISQNSAFRFSGNSGYGKPTKTILLLGETGAGKTSLIKTMVNYMLGVKWEDRVWFQIPEEEGKSQIHSQTSVITVNELETRSFWLRIIDTPGYGATEGVGFDKQITKDLQKLFQCGDDLHEIDVVGLVLKASQNRLTTFQHNIFKAILSVLGDTNIKLVVFVTHSDGLSVPNVITILKEAKVPCTKDSNGNPLHFMFNNRQHDSYEKQHDDLYHFFWDLSNESMKSFFSILEDKISKDVPRKRRRLVNRINNLKNAIQMSELKQKELQQIQEALEKNEETFEVDEPYKVKTPINLPWWHLSKGAMRCTKCEENCHYPNCWLVKDLSMCNAIENGRCTVCTNKCSVSPHVKDKFFYEVETRKVMKTAVDYSLCYIKKELSNREAETRKLFDESVQCIEALNNKILKMEALAKIDVKFFNDHMK